MKSLSRLAVSWTTASSKNERNVHAIYERYELRGGTTDRGLSSAMACASFGWLSAEDEVIGPVNQDPIILKDVDAGLGRGDQRQFNEAGLIGRVIDALRGPAVVRRLGPKNTGHESLRIAIVQREPTGLD